MEANVINYEWTDLIYFIEPIVIYRISISSKESDSEINQWQQNDKRTVLNLFKAIF